MPQPLSDISPRQARSSAAPVDVVLDTNVILDWLVFAEPSVAPMAKALASCELRWVAWAGMLNELREVLSRPGLERWAHRLQPAWLHAEAACTLVERPRHDLPLRLVCSDRADQKFIDLAIVWKAPWLLTRDKALLRLARRAKLKGVIVCRPEDWCSRN